MRYCTIPADLATLAKAQAGQELEVCHVLSDDLRCGLTLVSGDRITCRDVCDSGLVVSSVAGTRVHVPWRCARGVQVESTEMVDPAREDVPGVGEVENRIDVVPEPFSRFEAFPPT